MKNTSLYLECASGISGDMTVAALLDLGADQAKLLDALKSLNVDGYSIHISRVNIHGIDANDFDVILDEDHDHCHEHEHDHCHEHEHDHCHDHEHCHEHDHCHEHEHHHAHVHRNLSDVKAIIQSADISPRARDLSFRMFEIVAEAESKAHGKPVEEVHFHEVGAIDSIIDIVATAVCLDDLGIDSVIVRGLQEGSGFVTCQHGALPVPVPAVANIISAYHIPVTLHADVNGEMVTPTGAAIVAAVRTSDVLPRKFTVKKIGIGAGKRDFAHPNVLRAMLLEAKDDSVSDVGSGASMIETNIDNATGEELGFTLERLMAAGALDALYIPAFMKKNRPGWLLRVICKSEDVKALESVIFRNLPTIGVRHFPLERTCLERFTFSVATEYGDVRVKCVKWDGKVFPHPEYEDVRNLSLSAGVPYRAVSDAAVHGANLKLREMSPIA